MRAIVEHMAEMGVAAAAHHLCAAHAIIAISFCLDGSFQLGCIEAGPAGAGIEFGFRTEQFFPATDAMVSPAGFTVMIFAAKSTLSTFFPADFKLLR